MPAGPLDFIFRYFWLVLLVVVAFTLIHGRRRASVLVAEGRVSKEELNQLVRWAALLFGGSALLLGVLQAGMDTANPACLAVFPPRGTAGTVAWTLQAIASVGLLYWLWQRNGADLLARVAPAFLQGPVRGRAFSPGRIRLLLTLVIVVAPLGNILLPLAMPMPADLPWCQGAWRLLARS